MPASLPTGRETLNLDDESQERGQSSSLSGGAGIHPTPPRPCARYDRAEDASAQNVTRDGCNDPERRDAPAAFSGSAAASSSSGAAAPDASGDNVPTVAARRGRLEWESPRPDQVPERREIRPRVRGTRLTAGAPACRAFLTGRGSMRNQVYKDYDHATQR